MEEEELLESPLLETTRRNPERWVPVIQRRLQDTYERYEITEGWRSDNELRLLTILRRLEGRPDPLTIETTVFTQGLYEFPDLPVIGVRLLHTEGETETFALLRGGTFDSTRSTCWDMQLADAEGRAHVGRDDGVRRLLTGSYLSYSGVCRAGLRLG